MQAEPSPPLLSICISTYNAAHLLRVTLGAVLPQVLASNGRAELLVVDDLSKDHTSVVVEESRKLGPVRYIRNEKNLGSSANLVNGPTQHARGEFVWAWNQHCLLYPGALIRLLAVLDERRYLEVLYANFRCASYPEDWPEQAVGGYRGPIRYLAHEDMNDRHVDQWQDLLDPGSCIGTQSYAHIVRRSVWTSFWSSRSVGESYRDAITTYPHTCMLAECVFDNPSFYIGTPLITIFNGAQSWGDLRSRAKVWMLGTSDLIRIFKRKGWQSEKLSAAERWAASEVGGIVHQAFGEHRRDVLSMIPGYLGRYGTHQGVIPALWKAFLDSRCCGLAKAIVAVGVWIRQLRQYWFHNCLPARWIRAKIG
jgi:hypothetical protein